MHGLSQVRSLLTKLALWLKPDTAMAKVCTCTMSYSKLIHHWRALLYTNTACFVIKPGSHAACDKCSILTDSAIMYDNCTYVLGLPCALGGCDETQDYGRTLKGTGMHIAPFIFQWYYWHTHNYGRRRQYCNTVLLVYSIGSAHRLLNLLSSTTNVPPTITNMNAPIYRCSDSTWGML